MSLHEGLTNIDPLDLSSAIDTTLEEYSLAPRTANYGQVLDERYADYSGLSSLVSSVLLRAGSYGMIDAERSDNISEGIVLTVESLREMAEVERFKKNFKLSDADPLTDGLREELDGVPKACFAKGVENTMDLLSRRHSGSLHAHMHSLRTEYMALSGLMIVLPARALDRHIVPAEKIDGIEIGVALTVASLPSIAEVQRKELREAQAEAVLTARLDQLYELPSAERPHL